MSRNILILLIAVFIFSSCEKLIQIETPQSLNSIVVETEITTVKSQWEVSITESQAYYDQSEPKNAISALVTISDDLGNIDTLKYQGFSLFKTDSAKAAVPGRTYFLHIEYDGQEYDAMEYCRFQNDIDTFTAYFLPENNGFIEKGWYAFQKSLESELEGDYYEWMIYKNDTLQDQFGYVLDEDRNRDFSFFNLSIDADDPLAGLDDGILPRPFPFTFDPGDTIIMDQYCFGEGYYNFLIELQNQQNRSGTPFDPPPANPISNISNGAYGYFAVKNIVTAKTVIPL
ncbi:MAG: DUF4249 domain-containing protein [Bacteroidia bacterium]